MNQIASGILGAIADAAGDVLEAAGEDASFFSELATQAGVEALKLAAAKSAGDALAVALRESNLRHLKAQAEIRAATVAVREEHRAVETLKRVVGGVFGAVIGAL